MGRQPVASTSVDCDTLLRFAPVPLLFVDDTYRVSLMNSAAIELLGGTVAAGTPLNTLWVEGLETRELTGADDTCLELPLRSVPGTWVRTRARRVPSGGWILSLEPIADRHAADRAVLAARSVGIGTWEVDLQTGRAFWDEQMWILRGLQPRSEPILQDWGLTLVHPDDQAHLQQLMRDWGSVKEPVEYEFRVIWPDGRVRWLASRSIERQDPGTGARSRLGVNWDVTQLRAVEAAHREGEAARAENQAKSRFLSRMSHELRTPLNAVLGFSQLLLDDERVGGTSGVSRQQAIEHISNAGRHLLGLIDDVLELSQLQGGEQTIELKPVALRPVVLESMHLLPTFESPARVALRPGVLAHAVMADPRRLRQMLLNLLSNAVKYNVDGGSVSVESTLLGHEVSIVVSDTGHGMTVEQREHLFEPFNRLGRERSHAEGTGIGLVITKALVDMMGGRLEVHSAPGQGTRIDVRLMVAQDAEPRGSGQAAEKQTLPIPSTAATTVPTPRRVLYIEDNEANARLVVDALRTHPHIALSVAVGAD